MFKTMKCKCGNTLYYNNRYQCYKCQCGKCYNGAGSELASLNTWKDQYDSEDY